MAPPVGTLVFWSVLASTPLGLRIFGRPWGGGLLHNVRRLWRDYFWHWMLFALIVAEKNWVDALNDPVRGVFGDKTWLLYEIEGDFTAHVQSFFLHPALTAFLSVHYLWLYVFLNYFTVMLWAYRDDRELASTSALTYSIIYLLAVPFYIFFNVQVTGDFIPEQRLLLYHANSGFYQFFLAHDPLDNAFPSLHIAIPVGLILAAWWAMRRRGYTLGDWEGRRYLWFMLLNTALFGFSILYLGIHWLTDIPGGILLGLLGAAIADEWQGDFFRFLDGVQRRVPGLTWLRTGRHQPGDGRALGLAALGALAALPMAIYLTMRPGAGGLALAGAATVLVLAVATPILLRRLPLGQRATSGLVVGALAGAVHLVAGVWHVEQGGHVGLWGVAGILAADAALGYLAGRAASWRASIADA